MDISLIVLDVDGVLTDGTFLLRGAEEEWKAFYAPDGLGIRLAIDSGIRVVFLSGRSTAVVVRRGKELGVHAVISGRLDKREALGEICRELDIGADAVAYMGDDLVDIPAMRWAGLGAAPAGAREEACAAADWIAPSAGGRGAVRDLCEHVLKGMGLWEAAVERFA